MTKGEKASGKRRRKDPGYQGCWSCFLGRHGDEFDPSCPCCRNGHARMK
jgi:hypothetical protein